MAVRINDELSKVLGDDRLDPRVENWVRLFLCLPRGWADRGLVYSGSPARYDMARHINSMPGFAEIIQTESRQVFLPEERFLWLTDDSRQNAWMLRYLKALPMFVQTGAVDISGFLSGRQRIIALFDVHQPSGEAKEFCVNDAKLAWEAQKQRDRVFDWFRDEAGTAGVELMGAWLSKQNLGFAGLRWSISSHDDLLSFFDNNPLGDLEIKLMMIEIKRAWSQKKYRASLKDRRQCNLILRESTISKLDKLAGKHDLSRAELLEILINAEQDQGVYINQKRQRRSDLMH